MLCAVCCPPRSEVGTGSPRAWFTPMCGYRELNQGPWCARATIVLNYRTISSTYHFVSGILMGWPLTVLLFLIIFTLKFILALHFVTLECFVIVESRTVLFPLILLLINQFVIIIIGFFETEFLGVTLLGVLELDFVDQASLRLTEICLLCAGISVRHHCLASPLVLITLPAHWSCIRSSGSKLLVRGKTSKHTNKTITIRGTEVQNN